MAAYLISFALPVLDAPSTQGDPDALRGIDVFLLALTCCDGKLIGFMILPAWLPNPIYWFAVHAFRRGQGPATMVCGFGAAVLAGVPGVLSLTGGYPPELDLGYWLWFGSMSVMGLAGYLGWPEAPRPRRARTAPLKLRRRSDRPDDTAPSGREGG